MKEIVESVAEELCDIYSENRSGLVFPYNSNAKCEKRVSEQESRVLFIKQFIKAGNISFAIEAPTKEKYNFSGTKHKISAQFDLATYSVGAPGEEAPFGFDWVIELKANQPSQRKGESLSKNREIEKDFLKMYEAGCNALFFHTLESANSATIETLKGKMLSSYENIVGKNTRSDQWEKKLLGRKIVSAGPNSDYKWIIAILILKKKELLMCTINPADSKTFRKGITELPDKKSF
jgi:hypothetical protein